VSRAQERRVNRRRTIGLTGNAVEAPSIVPQMPKHVSVNCAA
jgi:hypothetical protein